jgi:hypothetical protein
MANETLSKNKRIVKVTWDSGLQISKGDEIEILRGIVHSESDIRATRLRNITRGRKEVSRMEGILTTVTPEDIEPPIRGIVEGIEAYSNETKFDLIVGLGLIEVGLGSLLKEASRFLDTEIVERCIYKQDAEDILTSAFRILEEKIREKIGVSLESHGVDLVAEAFHPETGKLTFGKTKAEREGLFHLFRSSILFLRNPPSHRFIREYSEFEIFEMVCLVNLLLKILEKSKVRMEQPQRHEKTARKPSQKEERRARKRECPVNVVKEVLGPLFSGIKSIILPLEDKWYRRIALIEWREMQDDERYFVVDEAVREKLDVLNRRLEEYSNAIYKLKEIIIPDILDEEGERIFGTSIDKLGITIKYKERNKIISQSCNIVECLISKIHPMDYVLKGDVEKELVDFEIEFGQVPAGSQVRKKFDEFWQSCVTRMEKNDVYNFVIKENDKLLGEANRLKKEIAKRIQEQLRG